MMMIVMMIVMMMIMMIMMIMMQVSEGQLSENTTAVYRTVPLRPNNVTFDLESIEPTSFTVRWSGPSGIAEFDR